MGVKANLPEKMTSDIRGGTRGGRDQFNWKAVEADKQYRANYLGNSVKAPFINVGGKDPFWYSTGQRTIGLTEQERREQQTKRLEEVEAVRRREREIMDGMVAAKRPLAARQGEETTTRSPQPQRQASTPRTSEVHEPGHIMPSHEARNVKQRDYHRSKDAPKADSNDDPRPRGPGSRLQYKR